MTEIENTDIKALEALVIDNPDLEHLEALIAEFNLFEAIGVVHQELRHSDFLSFLLDPSGNHGLGDKFLKRFLLRALIDTPEPPISPIRIELSSMDEAVIRREWQHIDILIEDLTNNLVFVIENKILSGEHGDQLLRYLEAAKQHFPDAQIVPIFLTPERILPSEENYISLSYDTVAETLKTILKTQASILGPDIRTIILHYVTMLRRHIVSDSEIAELCQQIYRRHQRALDLIFDYRPDLQLTISEYVTNLIESNKQFVLSYRAKWNVHFGLKEWESISALKSDDVSTGLILSFWFHNAKDQLGLTLFIGPGPDPMRQVLFELAQTNKHVFRGGRARLANQWSTIFKHDFLKSKDYAEATFEELQPKIDQNWAHFLSNDLPRITELVMNTRFPGVETH